MALALGKAASSVSRTNSIVFPGYAVACKRHSGVVYRRGSKMITGQSVTGVILADHVKSIDWKARAEKLGRCPAEAIDEVRARLAPLIGC